MRPAATLLAAAAACATMVGVAPIAPVAHVAAAVRLGLVSQTFNVAVDGGVAIVLDLPSTVVPAELPNATLVVTAYRDVRSRAAVSAALEGELPRSVDSIDLPLAGVAQPAPGQLQVIVALESTARTPGALQLPRAGLYPVTLEIRDDGEVLAELTTFLNRLPISQVTPIDALPVAIAVSTTSPVVLDDDLSVVMDRATIEQLGQLADILEASAVPVSVRVPPAHLQALMEMATQRELADRLTTALVGEELLSSPAWPLDPSAAAAADADEVFTRYLRDGEDILADAASTLPSRTIAYVDAPLSRAGGELLRDLGARLLVLTPEEYDTLPGTLGGFTDSSQLVQVEVAPGVTVDATVIDRATDDRLASPSSGNALDDIIAVSDLLAYRHQIDDGGGDPNRRGVTLATPDLALPPVAAIGGFTALLAQTPGLRPTTLDDIGVNAERLELDDEVVVGLPSDVPGDVSARISLAQALGLEALTTGSMLPASDPRLSNWQSLIDIVPTSALTDEQVEGIAEELRAEFALVRQSVVLPDGFSFTLTGRESQVPITLQNTSTTPLTVRVRMRSTKLLFPEGDQTVTLAPQEFTEVMVPIEARSRGRFPVTLEVLTPIGESRVAAPVPLTASVSALGGLGILITGAGLLVTLTWWVRNMRRSRRRRAAGTALDRHPATVTDGESLEPAVTPPELGAGTKTEEIPQDVADSGLSPDAATSTLPPS